MAARQPAWDEYEAVLLLEGLLDIKQRNIPRSDVIKRVSRDLRKMAQNRGNEIDDIFRNVNGITFQIQSMESAYCGYTVVKPASKLFSEIVNIYKMDYMKYETLLKEAKIMVAENKSVVHHFSEYPARKVFPAKRPALYSYYAEDDSVQIYTVDFFAQNDLAYTKPVRFVYFGEEKEFGENWTNLYVNFVTVMIAKYPNMFKAGMSFSRSASKRRVELAEKDNFDFMIAPRFVPESNYVVETNISAKDIVTKIKYILDLCGVDYENVVINYKKKEQMIDNTSESSKAIYAASYRGVSGANAQNNEQVFRIEEYASVLNENFEKGFRMDSSLEIRKFRRYYSVRHGNELEDTDEIIIQNISRMCILYDGKAFLPDTMLSEKLKESLLRYIDESFANGKQVIYFQALYNEFSDAFLDCHIYNADMLKAYLMHLGLENVFFYRSFISKEKNVEVNLLSEVRNCLQEYGRPMECEELFAALPHLPQSKIKAVLVGNDEFINNGRGTYFHESDVILSDEELENIAAIISHSIEEKEFIGGNELYDVIKSKYPYIIENNSFCSTCGFRDALKYKIGDRFSFKGNIISRAGQELSMADVFADYAKKHDYFTLTELQSLASELATVIYFDAVYENSLRISKEQFVSKEQARFDIVETDAALERVCVDNYIPIRGITNFGVFPYAGFPWNSFLLEHYVAEYSQKYMLLHSGYSSTECVGAIVKRSAGIVTFDDLIVDLLANSNIEMNKASVLQLLSDNGYLARRRYSNIESLIIKANALRNRKDMD